MTDYAKLPDPPYYSAFFTSTLSADVSAYEEMAEKMVDLAKVQSGFLGIESARNSNGFGITISFWSNLQSIQEWKSQTEHLLAQKMGREKWYAKFAVRISKVEKAYSSED